MNVILFGATGMVGQGVLRECLLDPEVEHVLTIGRAATGKLDAKLREVVRTDLSGYSGMEAELAGFDACFYCLGISSIGINEENYKRVTYDLTMSAARALVKASPNLTFILVSGQGADSSERGSLMWARIKGKAENDVLRAGFRAAYIFRPGAIQPLHGIQSRTPAYRVIYTVLGPVMTLLRRLFPKYITTTEQIGRAMLAAAKRGAPKTILENPDINNL